MRIRPADHGRIPRNLADAVGPVAEAQRLAVSGFQGLAKRQEEMFRTAMADLQAAARDTKTPEQYAALSSELTRKSLEQSRELGELVTKANHEVFAVLTKRGQESLAGFKALVTPSKA